MAARDTKYSQALSHVSQRLCQRSRQTCQKPKLTQGTRYVRYAEALYAYRVRTLRRPTATPKPSGVLKPTVLKPPQNHRDQPPAPRLISGLTARRRGSSAVRRLIGSAAHRLSGSSANRRIRRRADQTACGSDGVDRMASGSDGGWKAIAYVV